jgi:acetylaranotin biosynthesis cluster protein L
LPVKYEHLVEVNDSANPLMEALTREELWFGLLCRAEDPRPFLPGLEACDIVARTDTTLQRVLRFGQAVIRDRVSFDPLAWIRFDSEATADHAGGSLTISIEEPQAGVLFLRFRYVTTLPDGAGSADGPYAEFVKSAYRESDIDTMRVIRMIAESSRLQ